MIFNFLLRGRDAHARVLHSLRSSVHSLYFHSKVRSPPTLWLPLQTPSKTTPSRHCCHLHSTPHFVWSWWLTAFSPSHLFHFLFPMAILLGSACNPSKWPIRGTVFLYLHTARRSAEVSSSQIINLFPQYTRCCPKTEGQSLSAPGKDLVRLLNLGTTQCGKRSSASLDSKQA